MLVARLITNNLNRIRKISSLSSSTTTTTTTLIHHNYNFQFDDDSSARNVVNGSFMFQRRWHTGDSHSHHDLRSGKDGERIFRLGLAADIGLAASKAFTGYVSGSTAIIADAAHSVSDVVLSGVALLSFKAAMVPKDKEHPYGHGKFETLGALGISGVLLATAGGIGWHALDVLLGLWSAAPEVVNQSHLHLHEQHHSGHHHGIDMDHPVLALNVTILSIAVKEALYWITKRAGERVGSGLMKANVEKANRAVEVNEMWKLRQKELELENRLNRKSADKKSDTCHSFSVLERRSRERCDTDSGTSRSKKREIEDSHSCEEEGLGDAEIEEFLHSRPSRQHDS